MPARLTGGIGLRAALVVAATLFGASMAADSFTRPHAQALDQPLSAGTVPQAPRVPAGTLPAPSSSDESGTFQTVEKMVASAQPPAVTQGRPRAKTPATLHPASGAGRDRSNKRGGAPVAATDPTADTRSSPSGPEGATGSTAAGTGQAEPPPSSPPASDAPIAEPAPPPAEQQEPQARPLEPVISPPVPVDLTPPPHPHPYQMVVDAPGIVSAARLKGVQARVRLRLLVRSDGRVGRADVLVASGRPELDAAAVGAALGWRFLPARRDGEPIASIALIWVAFTAP